MKEDEIRRLMVNLLRQRVLKEHFSQMPAPHGAMTIAVHMQSGRRAPDVIAGRLQIKVCDGRKRKDESDIDFPDQSQNDRLPRNGTAPLKDNKILKTGAPELVQNLAKSSQAQ